MCHRIALILAALLLLLIPAAGRAQQSTSPAKPVAGAISKTDREKASGILDAIAKGIQERYYDPKMNGLDWNAVVANAKIKIAESNSLNEALTQIAIAVDTLHDSHTTFEPPVRPYRLDFGFDYQMIWSLCFVTRVRPGSDAETKGLKPGAQILTINGTAPSRQSLPSIAYLDYVLNPQPEMRLEVEQPPGEKRVIAIKAKMTLSKDLVYRPGAGVRYDVIRDSENARHRMRMQWVQLGDLVILKFPWFFYGADTFFDFGGKIRKAKAMIIDLRGDPGGSVDTLKYFLGMFFDHDVKLCDKVERKKTSTEIAKRERSIYFPGKVTVLVDSDSASASEIFARVMQLEKRGIVIGDRSSGSVMEATSFYYATSGIDYGAEVTVANLIMTDGKSLEHHGVNPDEVALPQPSDLESGRDPVLAQAAKELGVSLAPEAAGKLFPYEWPKD